MYNTQVKKKWTYGDPSKAPFLERKGGEGSPDWHRWIRFVNIAAIDDEPGIITNTEWDASGHLFGVSFLVTNENNQPANDPWDGFRFPQMKDIIKDGPYDDWSIETHQELFSIAMRTIRFIERIEEERRLQKVRVLAAVGVSIG